MQTKSLYQLKNEENKKLKPNMITDADYYLRDKEEEKKKGYPNTVDITGNNSDSIEEALQKKLTILEHKIAEMTKNAEDLEKVREGIINKNNKGKNNVTDTPEDINKTEAK